MRCGRTYLPRCSSPSAAVSASRASPLVAKPRLRTWRRRPAPLAMSTTKYHVLPSRLMLPARLTDEVLLACDHAARPFTFVWTECLHRARSGHGLVTGTSKTRSTTTGATALEAAEYARLPALTRHHGQSRSTADTAFSPLIIPRSKV